MKKRNAWSALPGSTPAEKLQVLGVEKNTRVDIRRLDEISRRYGVTVYLFFEEDLARNRPLETVIREFGSVPVFERPYISVPDFLRFTKENDPSFEQTLQEFPLMVEIVSSGITLAGSGRQRNTGGHRADAVPRRDRRRCTAAGTGHILFLIIRCTTARGNKYLYYSCCRMACNPIIPGRGVLCQENKRVDTVGR